MEKKNYSLVSYLTGEEYKKVRDLQKKLSEITGSQKCLVDWLPHITVGDGIIISDNDMQAVEKISQAFATSQKRVSANIKGFSGTENWKGALDGKITPYVIWLEVEVNDELLKLFNNLRDVLTSQYDAWLPRTVNYTPHITIAFADLTQEGYRKGMDYLATQKFETSFAISHVALVESYGEGSMTSVEYKKFYLDK